MELVRGLLEKLANLYPVYNSNTDHPIFVMQRKPTFLECEWSVFHLDGVVEILFDKSSNSCIIEFSNNLDKKDIDNHVVVCI